MPAPEPRKPSQPPQDEPATTRPANPAVAPPRPQEGPQEPKKDVAPEPVRGEDGRPVIAPITTATMASSVDDDEPAAPRPDETVPGGRYQVGDKIVNAHGEVLGDAPKAAKKK